MISVFPLVPGAALPTQAFRKCLLAKLMLPSTKCFLATFSSVSSLPLPLWNHFPSRGPGNALFSIASLICHHLSEDMFSEAWSTFPGAQRGAHPPPGGGSFHIKKKKKKPERQQDRREADTAEDTLLQAPVFSSPRCLGTDRILGVDF